MPLFYFNQSHFHGNLPPKYSKFVDMDPGPVKIYSHEDLPRLRYIAELMLSEILGLKWEIVTDKRKLGKNPVINYSDEEIKGSFRIGPHGLLSESGIRAMVPDISGWKGLPVFFPSKEGSDLPFDIFAASFYLISRYEEYSDFEPDEHGRFRAAYSLAYKNGFLSKPVIDLWAKEWVKELIKKFHNLVFRKSEFSALVTVDIDQPFEFLGKDIFRSIGGLFLDIGKKTGKAGDRYRTYAKGEKDPWDVFDYITDEADKSGVAARFFVPVGDRSDFDRQPSWNNEEYRNLVVKISRKYKIGLHPSYYASGNISKINSEAGRLKEIVSQEIDTSRYHFLRFRFPGSFSVLPEAGIFEDYSMGYADEPGFRAGIARPFFFYDLIREEVTKLRIVPFQVMDATLHQYRKMDSVNSMETVSRLIEEVKNVGGLFVSIWHNTSLLDTDEWDGWRKLFEKMLSLLKQ